MTDIKRPDGRLQLENVDVRRRESCLLKRVSCTMAAGELTVICGPNGAGKSTLLAVMAGSLIPDSGLVSLENRPLQDWPVAALARHRAVLSQRADLQFPFLVREVVALGRAPHRWTSSFQTDARAVDENMAALQVDHLADRNYLTLSGGERQRVHLARVMAQLSGSAGRNLSGWLLLDEPTAALDLKHQIVLMRILRDAADNGCGIVVVLHDLALTRRWADKCVLLKDGELADSGNSIDVLTSDQIALVFDVNSAELAIHLG